MIADIFKREGIDHIFCFPVNPLIDAVAEVGAKSPQQMGQVMKIVQPKVAGKADGGFVSGLVKAALAGN